MGGIEITHQRRSYGLASHRRLRRIGKSRHCGGDGIAVAKQKARTVGAVGPCKGASRTPPFKSVQSDSSTRKVDFRERESFATASTKGPSMFAEQLNTAIAAASLNTLDQLARTIWQGHAAGAIADDQAQRLAELIEARRGPARAARKPVGIPLGRASIFPPRRVQRSPDRARSIERRRTLAASGPMPPTLACRFTTGELAVLRIVADAVRDNGQCVLPVDAIAARAGVCRRLAQNAIREAARQGLLTVQERRREGRRNDTTWCGSSVAEWLTWIDAGGGCKKNTPRILDQAIQTGDKCAEVSGGTPKKPGARWLMIGSAR